MAQIVWFETRFREIHQKNKTNQIRKFVVQS